MSDENTNTGPVVDGERTIASVTAEKSSRGSGDTQKFIVLGSILIGVAVFAYFGWPRDESQPEQPAQTEDTRIRTTTQFQPADIQEPAPPPAPETPAPEPAEQAPVGPIERVRQQQPEPAPQPAELTEAEQLLIASRRAPVLAFSGGNTGTAPSAPSGQATSGRGFMDTTPGETEGGDGSLASALRTTALEGSRASVLAEPHLTITQGTAIPCNLDTAMDSSLGGMVRCTVTDDIFGTTGTVVLLERGTKIVGEYRGGLRRGETRLFVIWTRAETPKGVIVTLDSPATDALGRTGFDGVIDTQFWTRFSGTILLSVIDDALAIAATQNNTDLENTSAGARELASTELESTINVPIILRKPQGEEVAVMVARDLDFSSVYRLTTL
ncbi:type IV secretion system protein VirB10 [Parasulfitobacter algicola]|uniref:Type IV secretion system protein VirB10 n=1 Tax=Parasulfitobacter algicola TaxID=2614809 RepID=A0ABX2IZG9_9RHOB|nr:type IV secretion system protein VirB10 [Sulfitobacter algicola]NSX56800.1 type IV secretion system protein VirB10 [Sulfitobacter algicola]